MTPAATALANLRARLAELEARAAARRGETEAPAPVEPVEGRTNINEAGASWMRAHGRDWLAEAREDVGIPAPQPVEILTVEAPARAPEVRQSRESARVARPRGARHVGWCANTLRAPRGHQHRAERPGMVRGAGNPVGTHRPRYRGVSAGDFSTGPPGGGGPGFFNFNERRMG